MKHNNFKTFLRKVAATLTKEELDELLPTGVGSALSDIFLPISSRQGLRGGMAQALAQALDEKTERDLSAVTKNPLLSEIAITSLAGITGPGALLAPSLTNIYRSNDIRRLKDKLVGKKLDPNKILGVRTRGALAFGDRPFDYGALAIRKILKEKIQNKKFNKDLIPNTSGVALIESVIPFSNFAINAHHGHKAQKLNDSENVKI